MLKIVLLLLLADKLPPSLPIANYPAFVKEVVRAERFVKSVDQKLKLEARVLRDGGTDEGSICVKDTLLPRLHCIFEYSGPVRVKKNDVVPPKLAVFSYSRTKLEQFSSCGKVIATVNDSGQAKRNDYTVCLAIDGVTPVVFFGKGDNQEGQVTATLKCLGDACHRNDDKAQ